MNTGNRKKDWARPFIWSALLLVIVAGWFWYRQATWETRMRKVQHVNCINNMKQLGLGLRIWQGDYDGKCPFEVSTNAGGVMELVTTKNGPLQNGYLVIQCASNEMMVPLIAVCPQDNTKSVAKDWSSFTASNFSYVFPMTNDVLLVCPVDGNVLHSDGTVTDKHGKILPAGSQ